MAEMIDKWEVVNKLIQLQNQYNFYKNVWDADVLYRRIVELEIGIGKTPGLEVVRCKDCENFDELYRNVDEETGKVYCSGYCYHWDYEQGMSPNEVDGDDFCSYGERRKEN